MQNTWDSIYWKFVILKPYLVSAESTQWILFGDSCVENVILLSVVTRWNTDIEMCLLLTRCTHTHTHTHTHARTHARTYTHTHTHTHTHTCEWDRNLETERGGGGALKGWRSDSENKRGKSGEGGGERERIRKRQRQRDGRTVGHMWFLITSDTVHNNGVKWECKWCT